VLQALLAFGLAAFAPPSGGAAGKKSAVTDPIAASDNTAYCAKLLAPATDMSFRLFDPRWRSANWEAAKRDVLASCRAWQEAKQDKLRIGDLTATKNRYAQVALLVQDELLDATIERLGEIRSQKDTSLCFANATADVASYVSGKRVSVFSTAVRAYHRLLVYGGARSSESFLRVIDRYNSGLVPAYAVGALLDGPLCPDDQPRGSLTYTAEDLSSMARSYRAMQSGPYTAGQAPTGEQLHLAQYLKRFAPSLPTQDFFEHLDVRQPLDVELVGWIDRNCKIRLPRGQQRRSGTPVPRALDAALDHGSLPLITYEAGILQKGGGGHASLVVARATIQRQVYYLVRNSWGSSCDGYRPSVAKRCKQGHIWLTKKEMEDNAWIVDYLQYDLPVFPGSDR
jgi:hypothetical protein